MCPSNYNRFSDIGRKSSFSHSPLAFDAPVKGFPNFPSEHRHPVWYEKTNMAWLPDGEKISKISLFVFAQLTNVTDRRTPGDGIYHICICGARPRIPTIIGMVIEEVRPIYAPLTFFDPISSPLGAIENLWENATTAGKCL